MTQLILRYTGQGMVPPDDLQRVRSLAGCEVLEESGRMVVLNVTKLKLDKLTKMFPNWVASPLSNEYQVPDSGPKIKRPPRGKK